jgi:5'(3')-deoxyribonucleotidase
MRLFELEQQPNGRPEIFLDMDGVLADFFSEYAKLAGVPADVKSGRSDYRNIPQHLREPVIQQMVGTDFFYRLPKFASADRLVAMAVQVFGHYNICSSPLRGDHANSEAMKRAWIAENLNPQPRVIRITGRKGKYAKQQDGTPNILVDDRNTVLTEWEQSGGIGIKYQADEDGLDTVARGIRRAFEIVKGQREHEPQNIQSKDYGKMIAGPEDKDNASK